MRLPRFRRSSRHLLPFVLALFAGAALLLSAPAPGEQKIIVQSHRGVGVLAPENTLAAFELAWKLGTIPEADVRTTSDGIFVPFHDENFARVVHNASPELKKKGVKDVTFAELSGLEVGAEGKSGFEPRRVSSLEEVFGLMKGRPERQLYLDIKKVLIPDLAALVQKCGVPEQVILASTKLEIIREWKGIFPQGQTLLWMGGTEELLRGRIEELRKSNFAGVTQLQVHIRKSKDPAAAGAIQPSEAFLREVAAELKPRGILFQALPWEGNNADVYRQLLSYGVESFATDHPEVTMQVMREHRQGQQ